MDLFTAFAIGFVLGGALVGFFVEGTLRNYYRNR